MNHFPANTKSIGQLFHEMSRHFRFGEFEHVASNFDNGSWQFFIGFGAFFNLLLELFSIGVGNPRTLAFVVRADPVSVEHVRVGKVFVLLEDAAARTSEVGESLAVEVAAEAARATVHPLRSENLDPNSVS